MYLEPQLLPPRHWFEDEVHAEADAFWLLQAVISGPCRDAFLADNDASSKAEREGEGDFAVDTSRPSAGGGGLLARLSELERYENAFPPLP